MATQWTEWVNPTSTNIVSFDSTSWQSADNILVYDDVVATCESTRPLISGETVIKTYLSKYVTSTTGLFFSYDFDDYKIVPDQPLIDHTFRWIISSSRKTSVLEYAKEGTLQAHLQHTDRVVNIRGFDLSLYARNTFVDIEARIRVKINGEKPNTSSVEIGGYQIRVLYEPFVFPWTTPVATPAVFSATIDSVIGTYDSPSISERGIVYSTSANPTTSDTKIIASGTTTGSYQQTMTGLTEATTYYVRSYVIDTGETYYSPEIQVTTRTLEFDYVNPADIRAFSTDLTASIDSALGLNVVERGFYWGTRPIPTASDNAVIVGSGAGVFSTSLSGLNPETTYYFRAYMKYVNSPEVEYISGVSSFTTPAAAEVPKTYLYKFYSPAGTYNTEFYASGFDVASLPEYKWTINGGKGAMKIKVAGSATDVQQYFADNTNFSVEVIAHDKESPAQGQLIYTGHNVDNSYTLTKGGLIILEPFLYISGEKDLANKVVENVFTGSTTISYTSEDVADIIRDLLDKYALKGGYVTYDSSSIIDTGVTLSITVKNEQYLEAINRVMGYLPREWHYYIDGANKFWLQRTDLGTVDHRLYLGREVVGGAVRLSFGEMVNGVFFHGGDTGGGTKLYKKYSSSSSQSNFGVYERIISDERVTSADTAELRANSLIANGGAPIRYIEMEIIDSNGSAYGYDIESFRPGQTIQVLSSEIPTQFTYWQSADGTVGNMVWGESFWGYDVDASLGVPFQIQEIQYSHDRVIIRASDTLPDLATTIEQLEKKQQMKETVDSPTSPV